MRIIKEIPISQIQIDRLPLGLVSLEYANKIRDGVLFPPIKVERMANGRFKVKDGRHRFLAHKLNDKKVILAKFALK